MSKLFPRELTVVDVETLSPNMRRIKLYGSDLDDFILGHEGGYVKLLFPLPEKKSLPSSQSIEDGEPVLMRTYTIRKFDAQAQELTIDFVLHGNSAQDGPASSWAKSAMPEDSMLMYGPSPIKSVNVAADWFFLAGDMTALPAVSCHLESLPYNAKGYAVLEINSEEDRQQLKKPAGVEVIWVVNPHPDSANTILSDVVKKRPWLAGKPSIWAACEFSNMRLLRAYFKQDRNVLRDELYVSSYWKMGKTEDKHKIVKRLDAQAHD
jgi:NADPH-dependent ferric siderophore reductase